MGKQEMIENNIKKQLDNLCCDLDDQIKTVSKNFNCKLQISLFSKIKHRNVDIEWFCWENRKSRINDDCKGEKEKMIWV